MSVRAWGLGSWLLALAAGGSGCFDETTNPVHETAPPPPLQPLVAAEDAPVDALLDVRGDVAIASAAASSGALAQVLRRGEGGWERAELLSLGTEGGGDAPALAAAIAESALAVATPGAVHLFEDRGAGFVRVTTLGVPEIPYPAAAGWSAALAFDGDVLVVGAVGVQVVTVFQRSADSWVEAARLGSPYAAGPDEDFGRALALTRDQLLVGSPRHSHGVEGAGAVFVFTRAADGDLELTQEIVMTDQAGRWLGSSLSVDGDLLLVGEFPGTAGEAPAGAAHLYRREGDQWLPEVDLGTSATDRAEYFGKEVALVGGRAIVAGRYRLEIYARREDGWVSEHAYVLASSTQKVGLGTDAAFASYDGAIALLEPMPEGEWQATRHLHDLVDFGATLAIDGDTVFVGAPSADAERGAVFVFEARDGAFVETQKLALPVSGSGLGAALAADRGRVALLHRDAGVFVLERGEAGYELADRVTPDPSRGAGCAVDLSGDTLIIGFPASASLYRRDSSGSWLEILRTDGLRSLDGSCVPVAATDSTALAGTALFVRSAFGWTARATLEDGGSETVVGVALDHDDAVLVDWSGDATAFMRAAGHWFEPPRGFPVTEVTSVALERQHALVCHGERLTLLARKGAEWSELGLVHEGLCGQVAFGERLAAFSTAGAGAQGSLSVYAGAAW